MAYRLLGRWWAGRKLRWGPEGELISAAGSALVLGWVVCASLRVPRAGAGHQALEECVVVGGRDSDRLVRSLRQLNTELAAGCVLELACASAPAREGRRTGDGLVLLGIMSSGAIAVVPVTPARTRRKWLLSLSGSIAECAMLLGLGTGIYAPVSESAGS